jgi:signal transduction histidine kinase
MNASVRHQAFNPFFTRRRDRGCTGLGLHIVHNIVTNRLGGTLSLDSEPNEGTRIRMILPRMAPSAVAAEWHEKKVIDEWSPPIRLAP